MNTEEFVITMTKDEVAKNDSCGVNDLVNDPLNDLVNDLVNDPLKSEILDLIKSKPNINYNELAVKIGVSTATIKRHIQQLKSKGIIERFGSDKTGEYRIICKTKNNGVQYQS
jgi:ATP-dependent DNA helicase RecG